MPPFAELNPHEVRERHALLLLVHFMMHSCLDLLGQLYGHLLRNQSYKIYIFVSMTSIQSQHYISSGNNAGKKKSKEKYDFIES